jgi:Rrf2 family protein
MKLHKATVFGLYAVLELARDPGRQLSTADIAERYDISTHHLAKVMRTLVRGGLVQSVRGAGGGYRFSGNANRVTLMDIITLFETVGSELNLAAGEVTPPTEIGGALQAVRDEIDDLTRATLQSITLKTLIKSADKRSGGLRADEPPAPTPLDHPA